jgi:dihydrofolate reductase
MNTESRISLIAAVSENGVIGAQNRLPWHLPDDLRHFRAITTGHTVITGRKNCESIGKPLPNRRNIVITRQRGYQAPGCEVAHSLAEALAMAADEPEVFVIGGAQLYAQALPLATRLYLTEVHATVAGDTHFPALERSEWQETGRERHGADERHAHAFSFVVLERKRRPQRG